MKRWRFWGLLWLGLWTGWTSASAQVEREQTLAELEQQLQAVQAQMAALQSQIKNLQTTIAQLKQPKPPVPEPLLPAPESLQDTSQPQETHAVASKLGIQFYGKIKADLIHDSNDLGNEEYILFIPQFSDGESQTSFTARETRMGFNMDGRSISDWTATGKFESDFYGSAQSGGSGSLRLRLAYAEFKKDHTSIRIGQDWVPVAALNPSTTNFTIMGYAGNLWGRVPQLTVRQQLSEKVTGAISLFRYRNSDDVENFCDTDLEMPWIAGKLGLSPYTTDNGSSAFIGLSGAWRKGTVNDLSVEPKLAALEFYFPGTRAALTGEVYWGEGLGPEFFHRRGAFNTLGRTIETHGGFLQLGLQAAQQTRFHIGCGFDDPRDTDVLKCGSSNPDYPFADNFFQQNAYAFANISQQLGEGISTVLEGTWVDTDWSTGDDNGFRLQGSLIYLW